MSVVQKILIATRCLLLNIMFLIPEEILQSHSFLMSRKFETQNCQLYEVKQMKSIFADQGNTNSEAKFGMWPRVSLYYHK